MPETNLLLLDDLQDNRRTSDIAQSDLEALRAVADRIKSFIARPHKDLGRAGPVCPFVPESLERKALWLAPERIGGRGTPAVVDLVRDYQNLSVLRTPASGVSPWIFRYLVLVVGPCLGRLTVVGGQRWSARSASEDERP
jgi:hypothetical protein